MPTNAHSFPVLLGRRSKLLPLVAAAMVFAGCLSGAASSQRSSSQLQLTVGYFPGTTTNILDDIALHNGFFTNAGLSVQLVPFTSSVAEIAAVQTGSLNIMAGASAQFLAARVGGTDLRIVTGNLTPYYVLVANSHVPQMNGTYPQNVKALAGDSIGVAALGVDQAYLAQSFFDDAGMSGSSAPQLVGVGGNATLLPAFQQNSVQAVLTIDPLATQILNDGTGNWNVVDLRNSSYTGPPALKGLQIGMKEALGSWVAAHPAAVTAYQKAISQADIWMHNPANLGPLTNIEATEFGGTVTGSNLTAVVASSIGYLTASYSPPSLDYWNNFDVRYKLINALDDTSDAFAPNVPATEAAVAALAAPAATRLNGTITSKGLYSLQPMTGLSAGAVLITVTDRSEKGGFRFTGPGVTKLTGAKFTGTVTWKLTLAKGTYKYGSSLNSKQSKLLKVGG